MGTSHQHWVGKYGVANSAGLIDIWEEGPVFDRLKDARTQARAESARGWLGECWAVRFIYNPVKATRS